MFGLQGLLRPLPSVFAAYEAEHFGLADVLCERVCGGGGCLFDVPKTAVSASGFKVLLRERCVRADEQTRGWLVVIDEAKQQSVVAFVEVRGPLCALFVQRRKGIIGFCLIDDARNELEGKRRVNAVAAAVLHPSPSSPSAL